MLGARPWAAGQVADDTSSAPCLGLPRVPAPRPCRDPVHTFQRSSFDPSSFTSGAPIQAMTADRRASRRQCWIGAADGRPGQG